MDELRLVSGRHCRLIRIERDLIPDYYVLAFPASQGQPSPEEVREMLTYGMQRAGELAEQRSGDDQASVAGTAALLMDHPPMLAGAVSFVIGHLVGMVLVAIAVVRAKVVPWWVGLIIAVAQPVHVVSAVVVPNRLLDVVLGWGATTVGYALVAGAVLRTADEEWDLQPQAR